MCMNGKCGRCGAACEAPEPKQSVTTAKPTTTNAGALLLAQKAAAAKARGKRYSHAR